MPETKTGASIEVTALAKGEATIKAVCDSFEATYDISVVDEILPVTVSETIKNVASNNKWEDSTKYNSFNLDENITVKCSSGTNTGKYYSKDLSWRLYSSEKGQLIISSEKKLIISVTITFLTTDSPTVKYGSNTVTSGSAVNFDPSSSITFDVTSGKLHLTAISVQYK